MTTTMTYPKGLEQFLPIVPKSPPTARHSAPKTQRKRRGTVVRITSPAQLGAVPTSGETKETRRAKSIRMAQSRMVNLLRAYRLLGNLASRNYEYDAGEIERMEQTLQDAHSVVFSKFRKNEEKKRLEETFSLVTDNI